MDAFYSRLEAIGFVKLAGDLTEDTVSTIIALVVCTFHDYESRYYDSSPFRQANSKKILDYGPQEPNASSH